jgi:hypothetical protein
MQARVNKSVELLRDGRNGDLADMGFTVVSLNALDYGIHVIGIPLHEEWVQEDATLLGLRVNVSGPDTAGLGWLGTCTAQ